jgi:hypothetical protein
VSDQDRRHNRLRYSATGALAALAAVGAIMVSGAFGASRHGHHHATAANAPRSKTPTSPSPAKRHVSQPGSDQPFLNAIQQLVADGTITSSDAQMIDRQIRAGRIDTDTLTGLSQSQVQAVEGALDNAKRALAPSLPGQHRGTKTAAPRSGRK